MSQNNWPAANRSRLPGLGSGNMATAYATDVAPGALPALTSASVEQRAMSFANALPLSGVDMSALKGVSPEQLSAIFRLFQAGAVAPPAVLPTVTDGARPQAVQAKSTSREHLGLDLSDGDINGAVSDEQEEGEVDELETPEVEKLSRPASENQYQDEISQKKDRANAFLVQLYQTGLGFDSVSPFVKNVDLLRHMYEDLELVPAKPSPDMVQSPGDTSLANESMASKQKSLLTPSKLASVKTTSTTTNPRTQVDRTEYLAKLAAAKAKKHMPEKAVQTSIALTAIPTRNVSATTSSKNTIQPQAAPVKSTIKTDLIRQRLEALRRAQAEKISAATSSTAHSRTPEIELEPPQADLQHLVTSDGETGSDPDKISLDSNNVTNKQGEEMGELSIPPAASVANLDTIAVNSLASPAPFSRFPGLFMSGSTTAPSKPVDSQNQGEASFQHPVAQTKRSAPPEYEELSVPTKRPFGQSRQSSSDEQLIITVSEDEDDERDIEDDASDQGHTPHLAVLPRTPQSGDTTRLQTPLQTMSEYERKLEEIAAFRRRIAERERKAKSNNERLAHAINVAEIHSTTGSEQSSTLNADLPMPIAQTLASLTSSAKNALGTNGETMEGLHETTLSGTSRQNTNNVSDSLIQERSPGESEQSSDSDMEIDAQTPPTMEADNRNDGVNEDLMPVSQETSGTNGEWPGAENEELSSDEMDIESDDSSDNGSHGAEIQGDHELQGDDREGLRIEDEYDTDDDSEEDSDDSDDSDGDDDDDDDDGDSINSNHDGGDDHNEDDDDDYSLPEIDPDSPRRDIERTVARTVIDAGPAKLPQPSSHEQTTVSTEISQLHDQNQDKSSSDAHFRSKEGEEKHVPKSYFSAYESPLTRFKDYRYHTTFLDNASSGHSSLTYSHGLDVNDIICPYEAAGGRCNDKNCIHQHFQTMGLSGPELLNHAGAYRAPTDDPEEAQRWKDGLDGLINDIRSKGEDQNAAAVATRLAQYRREFLNDPTKTLYLG